MKHAFRHPIPIAWTIILFPVCLVAQELRPGEDHGFNPYASSTINQKGQLTHLRSLPGAEWRQWATISKVSVAPSHDRTGLLPVAVLMCLLARMPRRQLVHHAAREVSGAVLTAVATATILAPIPVWKRVGNRRADP